MQVNTKVDESYRYDPLLVSLYQYSKLYDSGFDIKSISLTLQTQNIKDTDTFIKTASKVGLSASLIHKPLKKISKLHFPLILLLEDGESCILEDIVDNKAKIIYATKETISTSVALDDLESLYLGFAYLIKKEYKPLEQKIEQDSENHWFFGSLKHSISIYYDVLIATFLVNLFVLATPLFTMNVYDRVIPNSAYDTLYVFTIGIVFIYFLDMFMKFTRSYLLEIAAKKSDILISSKLYERVLSLKMKEFPSSVGSFSSNLRDFDYIRSMLTNATITTLIDIPFVFIFLGVIYYIGGSLVLVPMLTITLMLISAFIIKKPLQKSVEESHQASAYKSSIVVETLQNIETVKTQVLNSKMLKQYEDSTADIAQKNLKTKMLSVTMPTITNFLIQLNTILVVFYGVFLIGELELTMGGLIAVVILTSRSISPVGQASSLIINYEDAKSAYKVLDDIMKMEYENKNKNTLIKLEKLSGKIEFKNVSFSYDEKKALDDVSFTINSGESVAIIGRIGSGKSTIEKIILGLYEVDEGSVFIDDVEISQIDTAFLRDSIAYVPQDISLFSGTLKSNIINHSNYVNDAVFLDAVKRSGVEEFAKAHPKGFDMPIAQRNQGLSGGQKQSVGIARALIQKRDILLFDEPTNAMDSLSEARLIKNLSDQIKSKTFVLVTQKLSLLSLVDRVIVLDNGKILIDDKTDIVVKFLQGTNNA